MLQVTTDGAANAADAASPPPVRALLPMACDGVGPSYTCLRLMEGIARAGSPSTLHVGRRRIGFAQPACRSALPGPLARLPWKAVGGYARRAIEADFLASLKDGEIAYLWPASSLAMHEAVHRRGNPIVLEGINTRMVHAKAILDRAYESVGLAPAHGITEARIADEEAKLALTDVLFAPSPAVEASHRGLTRPARVIPARYGVGDTAPRAEPPRAAGAERPVFLFVGSLSIRKGVHRLLSAWAAASPDAQLVLAGRVEPAVAHLCADALSRPDVRLVGFVTDVSPLYRMADVFILPSYEEGDPLVTYEAAAHGLPVVASAMGAGRMGADTGFHWPIDPDVPATIEEALRLLAGSADARAELGEASATAVRGYDWFGAGALRAEALRAARA